VHARQCTKVNPAEVAGLPGGGVLAGIGAAITTGGVGRGDSIAVIGCGDVGAAAIAGAKLAEATTITAIDTDDREAGVGKGDWGATDTINAAPTDVVEAVQAPRT